MEIQAYRPEIRSTTSPEIQIIAESTISARLRAIFPWYFYRVSIIIPPRSRIDQAINVLEIIEFDKQKSSAAEWLT